MRRRCGLRGYATRRVNEQIAVVGLHGSVVQYSLIIWGVQAEISRSDGE